MASEVGEGQHSSSYYCILHCLEIEGSEPKVDLAGDSAYYVIHSNIHAHDPLFVYSPLLWPMCGERNDGLEQQQYIWSRLYSLLQQWNHSLNTYVLACFTLNSYIINLGVSHFINFISKFQFPSMFWSSSSCQMHAEWYKSVAAWLKWQQRMNFWELWGLYLQFIGLSGFPYRCKCLLERCCHPETELSHQTSKSTKLPRRPFTSHFECHGNKTEEHVKDSFSLSADSSEMLNCHFHISICFLVIEVCPILVEILKLHPAPVLQFRSIVMCSFHSHPTTFSIRTHSFKYHFPLVLKVVDGNEVFPLKTETDPIQYDHELMAMQFILIIALHAQKTVNLHILQQNLILLLQSIPAGIFVRISEEHSSSYH